MLKLIACFLFATILFVTCHGTANGGGFLLRERRITHTLGWKPILIRGNPALSKNDAPSRIDCPRGYYIAKCNSNMEGLERYDGTRIMHHGSCTVFNSDLKLTNLTAVAFCIPLLHYAEKMRYFEVNTNKENVDYKCPEGYIMHSCYGLNYWSHDGEVEVIFGPNRCSIEKKWGVIKSIKLTFLCMKT